VVARARTVVARFTAGEQHAQREENGQRLHVG
jgi:hypothetical protein